MFSEHIAFRCTICGGEIYEGEDYYDVPRLGKCCRSCIDTAYCCDAGLEGPDPDQAYEAYREGVLDD